MTIEELDKLEQAIKRYGVSEMNDDVQSADILKLIAIARAAITLNDDGISGLFVWYDDTTRLPPYHCICCDAKHESARDFKHDDWCPYAAFVKAVEEA